jgi:O-antigen/teichoic acid export membrane protein
MFRSMVLMTGVGILLVGLFAAFGRPLLGAIFGDEATAAYGLVVWMAVAAAIRLLSFPLEPALISTGRAGTALVVRAATVVAFLACMATAIPAFGLVGAGIATLAAALIAVAGQGLAVMTWLEGRTTARAAPGRASAPGGPPAGAPEQGS